MMLKISGGILTIPECLERLSAQCEGSRNLDFPAPKDTRELVLLLGMVQRPLFIQSLEK